MDAMNLSKWKMTPHCVITRKDAAQCLNNLQMYFQRIEGTPSETFNTLSHLNRLLNGTRVVIQTKITEYTLWIHHRPNGAMVFKIDTVPLHTIKFYQNPMEEFVKDHVVLPPTTPKRHQLGKKYRKLHSS